MNVTPISSPILVTGAGGKTGQAIAKAISRRGYLVRALARGPKSAATLEAQGVSETVVADMTALDGWRSAMSGVAAVYHICPNVHPLEVEIGAAAIGAANAAGVERFVYHSVLDPAIEAMPHHWLKHQVEQLLAASGLPYAVLQPCAYMQNIGPLSDPIMRRGELRVPYSAESAMSVVDLKDVAEAAAHVLTGPIRSGATFPLCGPHPISAAGMAEILGRYIGRSVTPVHVGLPEWEEGARASGLDDYAIDALLKMFEWYDQHDFVGDADPLAGLLGRPPTSFRAFVQREITRIDA